MQSFFGRIRAIPQNWNRYWYSPRPTLGLGLFRIAFGGVLLLYHAPRLFGIRALYTPDAFLKPLAFWGMFTPIALPYPVALAANIVLVATILSLILGFRTRTASTVIFFLHVYFVTLERFSTRAFGDLISVLALLLIFAPAGAAISVDASLGAMRKGLDKALALREHSEEQPMMAMMLMRWQVASVYFFTAFYKFWWGGVRWTKGTDITNVLLNSEWTRQPLGHWLASLVGARAGFMGSSMVLGEFFIGAGFLIPSLRLPAVLIAFALHGFILVGMRVSPIFTFLMGSALILAAEPRTWEQWLLRLRTTTQQKQFTILYDGKCQLCQKVIAATMVQDIFTRVFLQDLHKVEDLTTLHPKLTRVACMKEIHLVDGARVYAGFFAFRRTARVIPLFWPLLPFLWVPILSAPIGVRAYRWISTRRYALSCGVEGEHVCHL